jgi:hypothetical protein
MASLYGLLHVQKDESHTNLKNSSQDPIDVYLRCAALCAASMARSGNTFALITNNVAHLRRRCLALGITNLELLDYAFKWQVPKGIRFYSAHYKLDIIEAFSTGEFGKNIGLIDIDTVLSKPLDLPTRADDSLIVYDITSMESASYGRVRIRRDLETVAGQALRDPRWYGGEFIMGSPAAFGAIAERIRRCWPNYLKSIDRLNHVGDEMIVSAAINLTADAGLPLVNADRDGGVARWWTTRTLAPMPMFKGIEDRSLLHFPGDKEFLAAFPSGEFEGPLFVKSYRKYAARRLQLCRIVNAVSSLRGQGRRFVAHIE